MPTRDLRRTLFAGWWDGHRHDTTNANSAGVLFDVDGTLLDTNYLHALAWWQAFQDTGHGDVPMSRIHRSIGLSSEELVERLVGKEDGATVEAHSQQPGEGPRLDAADHRRG